MAKPGGRPTGFSGSGTRAPTGNDGGSTGKQTASHLGTGNTARKQERGIGLHMVAEVLEKEGYSPAEAIVAALKGSGLDERTKTMVALELLQYTQPKLKAIEHKGELKITDEQAANRLSYLMSKAGIEPNGGGPISANGGGKTRASQPVERGRPSEEA